MEKELVLILDFGSQFGQLIARRVRELNVFCQVVRHDITADRVRELNPKGVILSGGPASVYEPGAPKCDPRIFDLGVPVLGICYGLQLANFLRDVCGCAGLWKMQTFVERTVEDVRARVGNGRVICGLSGGVDSSVCAALLLKAIGPQVACIYVDNGLMREGETEVVKHTFRDWFKADLHAVDARDRFLSALKGVTEPQEKRRVIGHVFIDVFKA